MTRKGQTHDICGAIMANGISICQHPPGWGTDHPNYGHCKHHGGNTPNARKNAAIREARVRGKEFGQHLQNVDPLDALRQELSRTQQLLDWARDMCQAIIDRADANEIAHSEGHPTYDERIPIPIEIINDPTFVGYKNVLDDERDRLVRIARASLDSSIQNRKQALAEALAAVVIDCFHAMTRQIPDLSPTQLTAAQDALKVELTTATERLLLNAGPS